jgi:hypothetical protein
MKICLFDNLNNLIDKELNKLPLDKAISKIVESRKSQRKIIDDKAEYIYPPLIYTYLPANESYGIINVTKATDTNTVLIDLAGPVAEVSDAIYLSKQSELDAKKNRKKNSSEHSIDYQTQLFIMERGIYFRSINSYISANQLVILNYFAHSFNKLNSPACKLDADIIDFHLTKIIRNISNGEPYMQINPCLKVLYETDELKELVKESLEKNNLHKIKI